MVNEIYEMVDVWLMNQWNGKFMIDSKETGQWKPGINWRVPQAAGCSPFLARGARRVKWSTSDRSHLTLVMYGTSHGTTTPEKFDIQKASMYPFMYIYVPHLCATCMYHIYHSWPLRDPAILTLASHLLGSLAPSLEKATGMVRVRSHLWRPLSTKTDMDNERLTHGVTMTFAWHSHGSEDRWSSMSHLRMCIGVCKYMQIWSIEASCPYCWLQLMAGGLRRMEELLCCFCFPVSWLVVVVVETSLSIAAWWMYEGWILTTRVLTTWLVGHHRCRTRMDKITIKKCNVSNIKCINCQPESTQETRSLCDQRPHDGSSSGQRCISKPFQAWTNYRCMDT